MKEIDKNGCNILIMTFTNLEKMYIPTTSTPPPTPLSSKVEAPKKSSGYGRNLQLNKSIQQIE